MPIASCGAPGKRWFFESGNDGARFVVEGLEGTQALAPYKGRIDAKVREFMETDGALPKCIAWIANRDLPPNTFPDS